MVHVRDVAKLYAFVLESRTAGVFHAYDGMRDLAPEVIETARSIYEAHGISSPESRPYVQSLLQASVLTSNRRSLSIGWFPAYPSFAGAAEESFAEFEGMAPVSD